jgi:hypothetical protein
MCIFLSEIFLQSLARASVNPGGTYLPLLEGETPPPPTAFPQKIEIRYIFKKSIFAMSDSLGKHP